MHSTTGLPAFPLVPLSYIMEVMVVVTLNWLGKYTRRPPGGQSTYVNSPRPAQCGLSHGDWPAATTNGLCSGLFNPCSKGGLCVDGPWSVPRLLPAVLWMAAHMYGAVQGWGISGRSELAPI